MTYFLLQNTRRYLKTISGFFLRAMKVNGIQCLFPSVLQNTFLYLTWEQVNNDRVVIFGWTILWKKIEGLCCAWFRTNIWPNFLLLLLFVGCVSQSALTLFLTMFKVFMNSKCTIPILTENQSIAVFIINYLSMYIIFSQDVSSLLTGMGGTIIPPLQQPVTHIRGQQIANNNNLII